jgi:DNA-binding XRE family transcriptional regulator
MENENKNFYREFGSKLAEVRNSAHITQQALGDAIGLSRTSITNIEKGRQPVQFHLAVKIAKVLGVQLDSLVTATSPVTRIQNKKLERLQPEQRRWVERIIAGASPTGGEDGS